MDPSGAIYKATGPPDHWLTTLTTGIWGFTEANENHWERLEPDDVIVFHSTGNDSQGDRWPPGVIGYGVVAERGKKDYPLWRSELLDTENSYPLIVYLSESRWCGALDRIDDNRRIDQKSIKAVHDEIDALLQNRLELGQISEQLGYNFPVQSAMSGMERDEEILDLLRSRELRRRTHPEADRLTNDSTQGSLSEQMGLEPFFDTVNIELSRAGVFDGLYFPLRQRERIHSTVQSALNAGKHVVFTGPPGTGKTELAENVCEELAEHRQYTGYQVATATADWSTFDTVGGYMPRGNADGALEFKPGQVLKRIINGRTARNEPLVIDEINRADIDKAFGQLFTLLSGQRVQLPFERDGKEIEVLPSEAVDPGTELGAHQFVVPESWRMLATMNSYDKTSLYEMSYAFMRRFAFVRVGVPPTPTADAAQGLIEEYLEYWPSIDPDVREIDAVAAVWYATNRGGRKIGPSLVRDMLGMVAGKSELSLAQRTTQAVVSYVLPQLEGVPERGRIVDSLLESGYVESGELVPAAEEMLQLTIETNG